MATLTRDQKHFGRRKRTTKRAGAPTASASHAAGFVDFVETVPAKLSAVGKLQATAKLAESARASTLLADQGANLARVSCFLVINQQEKERKKESESCASYVPCASNDSCASTGPAVSVPSLSLLERATIFEGELRPRPTRTRGASSSRSVRDTKRALYSLLRGSK